MTYLTVIKIQEQKLSEAKANARAAQMLAEMLAIVCHPEYYQQGEQTVIHGKCISDFRAFVVHFAGFEASIYWATFPTAFLRAVHSGGIKDLPANVEIQHTCASNLLDPDSRTAFIVDFIALVRYVADGRANIGHLRRPGRYCYSSNYEAR